MTFKKGDSNVPDFRFRKSSRNSTVHINTVFQAVFLEHEGNLILLPQKAASEMREKKKRQDHSFVNYAFLCSLGLGEGGKGFF